MYTWDSGQALRSCYLIGNPLVLKGFEELALFEGCEQALLVTQFEEDVAPVSNEGRPSTVLLVIYEL